MATLAPYSAKRTAMAWPMPEVPPVTSTFLSRSPRILPPCLDQRHPTARSAIAGRMKGLADDVASPRLGRRNEHHPHRRSRAYLRLPFRRASDPQWVHRLAVLSTIRPSLDLRP